MADFNSLPQCFGRGQRGRVNSNESAGRACRGRGRAYMQRTFSNQRQQQSRSGRSSRGRHDRQVDCRGSFDGPTRDDTIEELGIKTENSMCIAIQGCCHGELDAIYDRIRRHEEATGSKVDLLLCCGDFQSLRSTADYHSLAVPPKYRSIGSFYKYYSGEKETPVLTIFIGGNHEASQPLQELYYGGWVAPKIYYLGAAGVVRVGGVRIGGISGIYKSHDYTQGRFERPPYDNSTIRSAYHVRNMDVYRMKCLSQGPDIMLSHDWPQGIEQFGNTPELLRKKPFFRNEIERNDLGSPCNRELLEALKPKWWFSAHLHVKFMATVYHQSDVSNSTPSPRIVPSQISSNVNHAVPTESVEPEQDNTQTDENNKMSGKTQFHALESTDQCNGEDLTQQMTRFLSLDKCLPRRQFLSILHVPSSKAKDLIEYDLEWLAILKKTHNLTVTERRRVNVPTELLKVTNDDIEAIRSKLHEGELSIPRNFRVTVPAHHSNDRLLPPLPIMGNPQSDELLGLLGLAHVVTIPANNVMGFVDHNEIDLNDEEEVELTSGDELKRDNGENDLQGCDALIIPVDIEASSSVKILKKPRLDSIAS